MADEQHAESYIIFELSGTNYAIPSAEVRQMEMVENITPVPNAPACVEGVVFSRGQVIPAINLRARFGFEKRPHDLRTRLVVTSAEGRAVGLIVDTAREFVAIPPDAIHPPDEAVGGLGSKNLAGVATLEGRIVLLLDLKEVLNLAVTNSVALEAHKMQEA